MGVTPIELEANNGRFVAIVDFTGQVYEGILHYEPKDGQFSIGIWTDGCCFITFIAPDDVVSLYGDPPPPCLIQVPCCDNCLPSSVLMVISGTNAGCSCLVNEAYILEWSVPRQRYQFDYPAICGCSTLHAYLACLDNKWVCYIALKNEMGLTCVDGINLEFPLSCATMRGTGTMAFTATGTCSCGPCTNSEITITFSPLL